MRKKERFLQLCLDTNGLRSKSVPFEKKEEITDSS